VLLGGTTSCKSGSMKSLSDKTWIAIKINFHVIIIFIISSFVQRAFCEFSSVWMPFFF